MRRVLIVRLKSCRVRTLGPEDRRAALGHGGGKTSASHFAVQGREQPTAHGPMVQGRGGPGQRRKESRLAGWWLVLPEDCPRQKRFGCGNILV
jgi:hypothetical protein